MGHRHLQHHKHCTMLHPTPFPNTGVNTILWLLLLVCFTLLTVSEGTDVTSSVEPHRVFKRSATEGSMGAAADYPDYQTGVRYDEYPVVVPKRTALLLDRIMVALQKAVDDEKGRSFQPDVMENKVQSQNFADEINEIPSKDSRPREFDPRIFRIRGRQLEGDASNMI